MEKVEITEEEFKQILKEVNNKLDLSTMNSERIEGRVITVVNQVLSKTSGGIMMSKKDHTAEDYQGTYYSEEDFLKGLVDLANQKIQTSHFQKVGKVQVDETAVNDALKKFSQLYVAAKQTQLEKQDFYTVSRSDENTTEINNAGGLITKKSDEKMVQEGRYIDEGYAQVVIDNVIVVPAEEPMPIVPEKTKIIQEPTQEEVERAIENISQQPNFKTGFTKPRLSEKAKEKLKEVAQKFTKVLIIPMLAMSMPVTAVNVDDISPQSIDEGVPIVEVVNDIGDTIDETVNDFGGNNILEIGDVVQMNNGDSYDHNSQANDGISGQVGSNPYREEGLYTVDVIAVLDASTNEILGVVQEAGDSLDNALEQAGLTMEDVNSGKVVVRYNVDEGVDLNRDAAAGWVTYDKNTYQDLLNITTITIGDNVQVQNNSLGGISR